MNEISFDKQAAAWVVKRGGFLQAFKVSRLMQSVAAALCWGGGVGDEAPLSGDLYSQARDIVSRVARKARLQAGHGPSLTAETIQDLVELELLQAGNYEAARAYISCRNKKKIGPHSPRSLKVLRRDGRSLARFSPMRIASAIERGFRATYRIEGPTPPDLVNSVNLIAARVIGRICRLAAQAADLHAGLIQDEIERIIMDEGFQQVARNYIVYRAQKTRLGSEAAAEGGGELRPRFTPISRKQIVIEAVLPQRKFRLVDYEGRTGIISETELAGRLEAAAFGLSGIEVEDFAEECLKKIHDGGKMEELDNLLVEAALERSALKPSYSTFACRLLLDVIYWRTVGLRIRSADLAQTHSNYFESFIHDAVRSGLINQALADFDLTVLAQALNLQNDLNIGYQGLSTLCERCLLRDKGRLLETPQIYWMRLAMDLALDEGEQRNRRAIQFYGVLSRILT